nr:hypothetical protein [Cylindrospermum stagnale]
MRELLYKVNKVSADEIYQLVATEKIYVDLKATATESYPNRPWN